MLSAVQIPTVKVSQGYCSLQQTNGEGQCNKELSLVSVINVSFPHPEVLSIFCKPCKKDHLCGGLGGKV